MSMHAHFAVPGDIASLTGGYAYDREILARAQKFGVDLAHIALPAGFPTPSEDDLARTADILRALPRDEVLLIDGLAFGAFTPDLLGLLPAHTMALVHHPLALESGIGMERAADVRVSERRALAHTCGVIVTSASTKEIVVADYGVAAARIEIAMPGTARASRALGSLGAPHLLAVGSLTPRKGHDILVQALDGLADLDWSLTIAGSPDRAEGHVARLRDMIASSLVGSRIHLAGEVSDSVLAALYSAADVFVMPSLYEGYGMALGEAMVRGLPILATTGGAAAQTVPDQAALKVAPGDVLALRDALRAILSDEELRARLSAAAWEAGQGLPTWDDTAHIVVTALKQAAGSKNA